MKALIVLSLLGVVVLFAEIFLSKSQDKKFLFPVILIGLLATIAALVTEWGYGNTYYRMLRMDSYAILFSIVLLSTAFLWFISSREYFTTVSNITDHYSLILFSLVGGMIMTSYNHMVMLFLGIEILSIPAYVLAGSRKDDPSSNESAMKYFLMGAFATGFLLFGIALIYGSTGSFYIDDIANAALHNTNTMPGLFYGGVLLLLVGLAFKVSAAPFHFWTPDVYQGAPTMVTAFMATIVKTAAFAAFFRLFIFSFSTAKEEWGDIVWILSVLSLIIGNITAVYQSNVKRMLAYSSISHAGYMLLAIVAMNALSASSILYYTAAYSVASIASFAVLYKVSHSRNSDETQAFNGLAKTNPLLAFIMAVALLSMAGIPPLAGFFAKYYIFTSALQSGYIALVILGVLGSLVGVYYYFRIIIAMYLREADSNETIPTSFLMKITFIFMALLLLLMGIFPELVMGWLL